jgi:hypothetical protein
VNYLPTPYVVGVRKRVTGAKDAHGNKVVTHGATTFISVYSIAPAYSNEPFEAGRQAVVTGLTVLAPSGTTIDEDDLVVIDDKNYEVDGEIASWDRGPFGFLPGVSITLKRVEG